jgi:hypothetical protein
MRQTVYLDSFDKTVIGKSLNSNSFMILRAERLQFSLLICEVYNRHFFKGG